MSMYFFYLRIIMDVFSSLHLFFLHTQYLTLIFSFSLTYVEMLASLNLVT